MWNERICLFWCKTVETHVYKGPSKSPQKMCTVKKKYGFQNFLYSKLFKKIFYSFQRQRERRKTDLPLTLSFPKCLQNSWGWPSLRKEPGTQFRSPSWVTGTRVLEPLLPAASRGEYYQEKGSEAEMGLKPGTLI